jgi:aspartate kinase
MSAIGPESIAVLKIGGSILTDLAAYERAAAFIAKRRQEQPGVRLIVVVSAEHGLTSALEATARAVNPAPDRAALDLLWSTGELRSVALLVLALQALGVRAAGANVQQTGLIGFGAQDPREEIAVHPSRLLHILASHDVVAVPGFLARGHDDGIVSLGRGGSDLTAVLLAAALGGRTCEFVKDVDGYYTTDPDRDPDARHLAEIGFDRALAMADDGCNLLQPAAIVKAHQYGLTLVVRSIGQSRCTIVGGRDVRRTLRQEASV